jgi:hypothetical protein
MLISRKTITPIFVDVIAPSIDAVDGLAGRPYKLMVTFLKILILLIVSFDTIKNCQNETSLQRYCRDSKTGGFDFREDRRGKFHSF